MHVPGLAAAAGSLSDQDFATSHQVKERERGIDGGAMTGQKASEEAPERDAGEWWADAFRFLPLVPRAAACLVLLLLLLLHPKMVQRLYHAAEAQQHCTSSDGSQERKRSDSRQVASLSWLLAIAVAVERRAERFVLSRKTTGNQIQGRFGLALRPPVSGSSH